MRKIKIDKEIARRSVYSGRLLNLRIDTVELADGKEAQREVIEHPGAVAVVAITKDNELVLVRQYRQATGEILLEIPAGCVNKGESGEDCARRELAEETGYHAKKVKKIWQGFATPGYSNEVIQFYLALDLNMMQQNTDPDEFIEVDLVDFEACLSMLKHGQIKDLKTMLGIQIADWFIRGEL